MENSMEAPYKTKNGVTIWYSNPTPGYISRERHNLKRHRHPIFIAALFAIAKTWNPPKCSLTGEWVKKMWCLYTTQYYSPIKKKEWNYAICSNMDVHRGYHIKWGKSDREKQIKYDITYMWNLKEWYEWTYLQNGNRLTDLENKLMVTKGERGGEG